MWGLRPVGFGDLPGWAADDHLAAAKAFARHAASSCSKPSRTGAIGIRPEQLRVLQKTAAGLSDASGARRFFEQEFQPVALAPVDGARGFVTAFYEPEIAARRTRSGDFDVPFYRRPADLVAVGDEDRPADWDPGMRFGRQTAAGALQAYHDRRQINGGVLEGRGLEIAWVENPVDAFFAHVQGAARLLLDDGSVLRITYDGKNGHPFTPIGKLLVERGEASGETIGMGTIRDWLADNPLRAAALMEENRSYIFFREAAVANPADGPVAAAKIPLTPGRSLAVDRLLHTFGTPVHVHDRQRERYAMVPADDRPGHRKRHCRPGARRSVHGIGRSGR